MRPPPLSVGFGNGRGRYYCWLAALLVVVWGCGVNKENQWQLMWQDEFEGQQLDASKWEMEVNAKGGGNNELQYYVTNNVRVQDGFLFIEARKEVHTGPEGTRAYTSSRINTKNRGDWQYGRFEVRAKFPQGRGFWPAIWLLPTEDVYGGWPHSGEIDIAEVIGHEPDQVVGTLHFTDRKRRPAHQGTNYTLATGSFADDFHLFTFEWEPKVMRWYVDRQLYQTQTRWPSGTNVFPAPFDQRFHLILNLAVGGNWPGNPGTNTVFPQAMVVDYVRVYQKNE